MLATTTATRTHASRPRTHTRTQTQANKRARTHTHTLAHGQKPNQPLSLHSHPLHNFCWYISAQKRKSNRASTSSGGSRKKAFFFLLLYYKTEACRSTLLCMCRSVCVVCAESTDNKTQTRQENYKHFASLLMRTV